MPAITQRARHLAAGLAARGLAASGAVQRARGQAFAAGGITSLLFHNPPAPFFRQCIDWLRAQGYTFLTLDQLLPIVRGETTPPPGAAWLSFDDGWQANLTQVIPTLTEFAIPATFFITTEPTAGDGRYWWPLARQHRSLLPEPYRNDTARLWRIPEAERRRVLDDLAARVGPPQTREAMTVAELQQLAALPQISIGSHSVHHAILPNCSDDELAVEIGESQRQLSAWLGRPVTAFAYPNGDHDGREAAVLTRYGYELAATTVRRPIRAGDDPFRLPRTCVLDDITFAEAVAVMAGAWEPFVARGKSLLRR